MKISIFLFGILLIVFFEYPQLYFVLFVCSMIYKARIDKRLAEEELNKGGRMRLISHDENSSQMDLDSKPNRQGQ